jgi:hypothetical protein
VRWFFAVCDVVTAALVLVGVFEGLPARWMPIDLLCCVIAAALVGSAIGTFRKPAVARALCGVVLIAGLALFAMLAISASHLMGIYGPIGKGSALLLLLVAALVIPYLIALPAAQIVWLEKK